MDYKAKDGIDYVLNLIDTPGHVDFTYEVSRSLAACEGAILVVDATQGIEAQTISNLYLAIDHNLEIIPVLNKIDLPSAQTNIEKVKKEIMDLIGCDESDILLCSAKSGIGIEEILEEIVRRVPPPVIKLDAPLRALIYDSIYDEYRGVIVNIRVFDGKISEGDKIYFMATEMVYDVEEVGILKMKRSRTKELAAGNVGYIIPNIRTLSDTKIGDTVTHYKNQCSEMISGFKEVKPMVFSGFYPVDANDFESLREALAKLSLNDSAIFYEPETSSALGYGFRCGFLGLLHLEIVQERLEREFKQNLVTTVPNVRYKIIQTNGDETFIDSPAQLPDIVKIKEIQEPYIRTQIILPDEYIGTVMKLCLDRRGTLKHTVYLSTNRVDLTWDLPLAEVVYDFFDKLKSYTRGYASMDYEFLDYIVGDLIKLDILINGEPLDALSSIVHRSKSYEWGKKLTSKLKDLLPRQLFEIAIQAAIGNKAIARTTVKAMRKNVTAKCYGGDISRKRKLLEKQKEGKKRMKQVGNVEIPQEAFLAVLKIGDD
jgi:GTP-binding protein LepA